MKIWNKEVGPGNPCFIVAEGGSNHGGSLDAALALTDAAADAGANAMKWQLWDAEKMYDSQQFPAEYESAKKWQMPREWLPQLCDRAHERGLAFGCSAFDFDSLDYVDRFVDFHKVASIEATWDKYVHAVLIRDRPTFISLGMQEEITGLRYPWDGLSVIPLHCTVSYPCAMEDANLLSRRWPTNTKAWGLSDHTTHPTIAPCAAVALGACVVEKHLRPFDRLTERQGTPYGQRAVREYVPEHVETPDWDHSLNPAQFKEMVTAIRLTEQALGSSEKRIRESEKPYLKYRRGPRGLRGA